MTNRGRIVDTALRLFNESGTGAISTNHIAQALGISPGNLYYHFPNKEAIIRAIFARLREAWTAAALPGDRALAVGDLRRILVAYLELVWAYRFYYRELPALVGRDPELGARFREVRREGLANVETLLRHFIAGGVMRSPGAPAGAAPGAPDAVEAVGAVPELARAIWLLAVFRAFHQYAGVAVGEHLGYLFTAAWTALIASAMLTASPFPRWLGGLGLVAAAGILAGLLEPAGVAGAGAVNALSYILWSLWLIATGVILLRDPPQEAPVADPRVSDSQVRRAVASSSPSL